MCVWKTGLGRKSSVHTARRLDTATVMGHGLQGDCHCHVPWYYTGTVMSHGTTRPLSWYYTGTVVVLHGHYHGTTQPLSCPMVPHGHCHVPWYHTATIMSHGTTRPLSCPMVPHGHYNGSWYYMATVMVHGTTQPLSCPMVTHGQYHVPW